MSDNTTTWQDFLFELNRPVAKVFFASSPLMDMLEREIAERKRKDDEYLATLTDRERQRVLVRRRIEALERRYRNWWDENMAWRLAPHRPDREDCDD